MKKNHQDNPEIFRHKICTYNILFNIKRCTYVVPIVFVRYVQYNFVMINDVRTELRLPKEMLDRVVREAPLFNMTKSSFIRQAIISAFRRIDGTLKEIDVKK